ncbi:MAG: hypothetical protein OEW75_12410 [Cyclobacteriaceae bacterium]|nr:hypothetical protein [Cyclobacteriaceae bacterium]
MVPTEKNMELPGFVDLQVNGYLGIDFSSEELTEEAFIHACIDLRNAGTCLFLPTLITSPKSLLKRNLKMISEVMKREEFNQFIPGIHVEGPFLSPQEGARGAHNPEWMIKPDIDFFNDMSKWSNGRIKLITIAAELEDADKLCAYACTKNVTVSLGHQMATSVELNLLAKSGASALTHLGNGTPKIIDRHNNSIWSGLANDQFTAMIITDGHHIPNDLIKVILKAKPLNKVVVVSDASPIAGLLPGNYNTLGNDVVLSETGKLYNPHTGYLVGSSATMLDCMNYLAGLDLLTPEQLAMVGYYNPLQLVGLHPEPSHYPTSKVKYDEMEMRFRVI